ncbi:MULTISPECIES: DUF2946 domain-containing protein [Pseudomonas]|uniref:DUF2946 domain-containing protein n=1 Tax=Pseudomonas gessardii TaxID=78544 RepID=A0ABS9F6Y1_9PSED|nr:MULTISPECIES: DUF2946 domain-containing protein [Pseudomonas]MBH3424540.1 DUF2946 domain-containing protein [Pseudomonas gessardii]MCF4976876.1 DUF2946 domain-containing protein [Pseudomonas gessardii]MCF4991376.1 DUF2946 domain-containing protein [Pseudomonas gessardii]MCF5082809.1 DUF2946 domain-containing protein [Pseudomonas gessardii]MCF5093177.1 DUF2946 domain-containing protein [Pseudomonas gessardii]
MARQRFAFAWIACLAVLFNAFAMPNAWAMQQGKSPAEQLLWGSFCSSTGNKLVAMSLGTLEIPAPQQDEHSSMQHCWCCSGSAPLVALPGHVPQLYLTRIDPAPGLPSPALQAPTPRQQWPSLNPRASPTV